MVWGIQEKQSKDGSVLLSAPEDTGPPLGLDPLPTSTL